MKTIGFNPKSQVQLKGSEEIGVGDFIKSIGKERKRRHVDQEFVEDGVLAILNHKRKWKKTQPKKIQRKMKSKIIENPDLRLN